MIDCLQYNHHPSHYCLSEILVLIKKIKPKKTVLTNLASSIDYAKIKKILPKNVIPAYDGLTLTI